MATQVETMNTGALFVGLLCTAYLQSSAVSSWLMYLRTSLSSAWIQAAATFILLAAGAHTALWAFMGYNIIVERLPSEEQATTIGDLRWTLISATALSTFIAVTTEATYIRSLHLLLANKSSRRRRITVVLTSILAAAQLAFSILSAYSISRLPAEHPFFSFTIQDDVGWQKVAALATAVACFGLIAGTMMTQHRGGKWAVKAETVVEVSTRLVIETGALTAIFSVLTLVCFALYEASGLSLAFSMSMPLVQVLGLLEILKRDESGRTHTSPQQQKHESSLSDMFKGTPLRQFATSMIPTPIADLYSSAPSPEVKSKSFFRRSTDFADSPASKSSASPFTNLSSVPVHVVSDTPSPRPFTITPGEDSMSVSDYNAWIGEAYTSGVALPSPRSPGARSFLTQQSRATTAGRAGLGTAQSQCAWDETLQSEAQRAYVELRPAVNEGVGPGQRLYPFI